MPRSKKSIIVSAVVVFLVAAVATVFAVTGRGWNGRIYGQRSEQKANPIEHTGEKPAERVPPPNIPEPPKVENTQPPQEKVGEHVKRQPKSIKAKAIYLTGSSAGDRTGLERRIRLIKDTELNAVVIDIKDDGKVNYESSVPMVRQNRTYQKLYNPEEVLQKLHENNIYVIGRIVCFRDPLLAERQPDMAIKRPNGELWKENGSISWTNPYNREVWKYNIDIAKEAIEKGFDEIQFDYVRFPTARKADIDYGQGAAPKADVICEFLKTAKAELHGKKGAIVSADVFGIICESPGDTENIGQDLERIGKEIDYICPMVYPSHYANAAQNGTGQSINGVLFKAPDLKPYDVVYQSLTKGKSRISKVEGYNAKVRPYLQDFTASWLSKGYYQSYGPEQIRQQIRAVYDAGYEEWILWDANNTYTEDALNRE